MLFSDDRFTVQLSGQWLSRKSLRLGEISTMRPRFAYPLVGSLFTLVFAASQIALGDDAKDLQGTWRIVSLEANGENKPPDEFKGWRFVFEGDQGWLVKPEETGQRFKFKLDAAKAPKTIDLIVQEGNDNGKIAPGIYGFSGSQLRLCINIFGDRSYRPMEFKTQDKDGAGFAVLEWDKAG
jgi:uncharacterized protein (TIGR03067 family)